MQIGIKRDTIDKFYTKGSIASMCVKEFKRVVKIGKDDLIIEPSAGSGAFIPSIKRITKNAIFYDILPENEEIVKQDFLKVSTKPFLNIRVHAIGNPPFGRKSADARMFIRKCCEFCQSVSFILPRTFMKKGYQTCFPLNFHLVREIIIPDNSFTVDGSEHDVACVFQVWEKNNKNRARVKKIKPIGYSFVKKNDNPDVSIRRVGNRAGKVSRDFSKKNENTHYFLKFREGIDVDAIIAKLNKSRYSVHNVGAKSISKQQFISKLNKVFVSDENE